MASTTEPLETVRRYIDRFNKSDVKGMVAECDVPMSILDGLAPHVWHGPTASEDWHREVTIAGDREGATEYFAALGEPRHVNITGDCSYVVIPATMMFRLHGQLVTQIGSALTVALRKVEAQWCIMAWAWAKGPQ